MPSTMDGLSWKYENCMTIVSVLSIRCLTELKSTEATSLETDVYETVLRLQRYLLILLPDGNEPHAYGSPVSVGEW